MKGRNRRLPPPFPMLGHQKNAWYAIQAEMPGGTFRGHLKGDNAVFRAAVAAEHQAAYFTRAGLPSELLGTLKTIRTELGLPPLPERR